MQSKTIIGEITSLCGVLVKIHESPFNWGPPWTPPKYLVFENHCFTNVKVQILT